MTTKQTEQGLARQTASIEHFLNTCPAVLEFGKRGDGDGDEQGEQYFWFKFDPSVEVPVVPAGVWFDTATMTDEERDEWILGLSEEGPIDHDDCEAFYCPDCRLSFSLNELVERGVKIKNEDGDSEYSAYCPECPEDEAPRKMSNAGHLEAHVK